GATPVRCRMILSGRASARLNGHDVIHISTRRALVPLRRRRLPPGAASAAIPAAACKRTLAAPGAAYGAGRAVWEPVPPSALLLPRSGLRQAGAKGGRRFGAC